MTDKQVIADKLASLREHMGRARGRRPAAQAAFEGNSELQDALALSLLVAVQQASDIAMYITADEGWGIPGSYAEAFDLLQRNHVVSAQQAHELAALAVVKGRLAHGYAGVDAGRLWGELPAHLTTLDRYGEAIARYLTAP